MAYIYELVVVEGPLVGRTFRIEPRETTKIGRTCRDVPLFMDERASLEHARISWVEGKGFHVTDLGSETGTFIDGLPVPEHGAPLHVDSAIRVGQTVLRLEERRGIAPWVGWSFAVGVPMAAIVTVLIVLAVRGVSYEPTVVFASPIAQGGVSSEVARVPVDFIRRFGVDYRSLVVRRVTDHDADGRSELWMPMGDTEVVVEIDAESGWEVLAELPSGCSDRPGLVFPDQLCSGIRYRWLEWEGGQSRYLPIQLTSPIAWIPTLRQMDPEEDIEGAPPRYTVGLARPFLVSVSQPGRLAGFLAERGVTEPIHYLLCEGAFPGVKAQVLTASGALQTLEGGCIGQLSTSGPGLDDTVSDEDPVAVAFTANGYRALLQDARTFLLGDPRGALPGLPRPASLDELVLPPEGRAIRLSFGAESLRRQAIADEARLTGFRRWSSANDGAVPTFTVASIDSPGVAVFDPPGCAVLEVETSSWHCLLRRWCTPSSTFVTVRETGCSEPREVLTMSYGEQLQSVAVDGVELWLQSDVYAGASQIDVTRLRVGFRRTATEELPAEAPELDEAP